MTIYTAKNAALLLPGELAEYLSQFVRHDVVLVRSSQEAYMAAEQLSRISADRIYVMEILKWVIITKRQLKRQGAGSAEAFQDMVDSEKVLELTIKGLDSAYSAINRAISVHQESQRELQAISPRKGVNVQP